jgi:hypothetical protein
MYPIKYNLNKDQMWAVSNLIEHPLSQPCSEPLCPCGEALSKVILKANEIQAKNGPKN